MTKQFAYVVLHRLGWSSKDVQLVKLDSTNQVLALQTGQVDVPFTGTDNLPAALQHGARILGTARDYDLTIFTGFVASKGSLDDSRRARAIGDFVRIGRRNSAADSLFAQTVGCVGTFAANLRKRPASRCEGRSTAQ